jgi:hypothetical protein
VGQVLLTAFGGFMSLIFLGMLVLAVVALVMAGLAARTRTAPRTSRPRCSG